MKILMLVESDYPLDIRVNQEALKLKDHGHEVSVVAIKEKNERYFEIIDGIKVYRVPKIELFKRGKHSALSEKFSFARLMTLAKGIVGYGFEFAYFTFACYVLSWFIFFRDKFKVIHTHNPPDTLFIVALLWRPFGVKFVYDHHDLSPDLFLEKYGSKGRLAYKALLALEKISCKTADIIIATNESYKKIEIERSDVPCEKIYVVRNGPDLDELKIAEPFKEIRQRAKVVLCYLGAINIQDGVDNLVDVLSKLVFEYQYKDICLLIIGDGDYLYKIKDYVKKANLEEYVIFTGLISDRSQLCRYLSSADIFLDAAPKSFLNDNSTFIKHMEYMVFGKPVVSFTLKESMFSLDGAGVFVESNDTSKMAKVIIDLAEDKYKRTKLGKRARQRVKALAWEKVSPPLIVAYEKIKLDMQK